MLRPLFGLALVGACLVSPAVAVAQTGATVSGRAVDETGRASPANTTPVSRTSTRIPALPRTVRIGIQVSF